MSGAKIDLDELERKARDSLATPGGDEPWRVHFCSDQGDDEACGICTACDDDGRCGDYADVVGDLSNDECHHPILLADAEHIAANSPPVTLALVARIRELEVGLRDALEHASMALGCARDEGILDEYEANEEQDWIDDQRELLERGAVLP